MNFVTTNIRLPEEDYIKLKAEAAKVRKSLAAVIRDKIAAQNENRAQNKTNDLIQRRLKVVKMLKSKLKDFDVVSALREMRYEGKW